MKNLRDYNFVILGSTGWIGKNFVEILSSLDLNLFLFSNKENKTFHIKNKKFQSSKIDNLQCLNIENIVLIDLAFPTQEQILKLGNKEYSRQLNSLIEIKEKYINENQISHIFVSSSGAVYSEGNLYSEGKRNQEEFYAKYTSLNDTSLDVLRIFACIGPHYNKTGEYAFSSFMANAQNGNSIKINSRSHVLRSYVYIPHIVTFFIENLINEREEKKQTIDAVQQVLEIRELANLIAEVYGVKVLDNLDLNKVSSKDIYSSKDNKFIEFLKSKNINHEITKKEIISSEIY
tara:strand:+ start:1304 stop:2173 length:870 start_codon:yes stop_codon:yes gene_type:complete